ncbi:MAG: hypothetical protein Q8O72_13980 [Bacteroidales bacterium]|nr:hypothetical protein [Bacteroidales bacterium]
MIYSRDFKTGEYFFDFNSGMHGLTRTSVEIPMPAEISGLPMSLWNVALEIHTARIYQPLIGDFYILIVPLMGLVMMFILVSGFVVWYKRH